MLQKRVVIIHINKALAWIARLLYKFAKVFAAIIIIIVIYRYAETAIVQVNKMVNICLLSVWQLQLPFNALSLYASFNYFYFETSNVFRCADTRIPIHWLNGFNDKQEISANAHETRESL